MQLIIRGKSEFLYYVRSHSKLVRKEPTTQQKIYLGIDIIYRKEVQMALKTFAELLYLVHNSRKVHLKYEILLFYPSSWQRSKRSASPSAGLGCGERDNCCMMLLAV